MTFLLGELNWMLGWMTRKDIWIQKARPCATGFGNEFVREHMLRTGGRHNSG
jgi:hypothetical protein